MNRIDCVNENSAFRIKDLHHRNYRLNNKDEISNRNKNRMPAKKVVSENSKLNRKNKK